MNTRKHQWIKTSKAVLVTKFTTCRNIIDESIVSLGEHRQPILKARQLALQEKRNFIFPAERQAIKNLIQISSHRKELIWT